MVKYLTRKCPTCGGHLGIMIAGGQNTRVHPIRGICGACRYEIRWELLRGTLQTD